ncbi:hypothetical protein OROMI_015205 [Orobanche minor]
MTEKKREAPVGLKLPPELIYDILSLIPVRSIGRFRCVCKEWRTLLSDRQFLSRQFRLQTTKKTIFIRNSSFISMDFRNNNINGCPPVPIYETLNFKPASSSNSNVKSRYMICGSCNGLLLLLHCYEGGSELSIVNPITRESRQLPPLPGNTKNYPCSFVFGFGYCSYADDYVVIIPVLPYSIRRPAAYMFKRNKWETIENVPFYFHHRGAFVNGAIHSVGYDGPNRIIYAFDLAAVAFRVLELPEGLKKSKRNTIINLPMCVLGGCLCLVNELMDQETDICEVEIWVMKEYGVRDSWTKYFFYAYHKYRFTLKTLFFWNGDGSIIGLGLEDMRLVLYSLKQNTPTSIQLIEEQSMWTFTDSLFSPNAGTSGI